MRSALRLLPFLVLTAVIGFKLGEGGEVTIETAAEAAAPAVNACGCYRDAAGSCFCGKKGGKCACPGECEPQGCEEKRAKELQKEVDAEAKHAREAEKRQQDEQAAKAEKERKAAEPADDEGDSADTTDKKPGDSASARKDDDDDEDTDKPKKKSKKAKSAKTSAKPKGGEG